MDKKQKDAFFNIPNCLSLVRLALIPVYWVFYSSGLVYAAVAVFVLASITDLVDGFIARRFNMITKYGKVLDPLADKLMQVSALLSLTITGDVHWIITTVAFAKELFMIIGSAWLFNKHVVVYSNVFGKVATVLMSGGIFLALLAKAFDSLTLSFAGAINVASSVVLAIGIVSSLLAGVIYTVTVVKNVKGKISDDKAQNEKIDLNL